MTNFWCLKRVWLALIIPLLLILMGNIFSSINGGDDGLSFSFLSRTSIYWLPLSAALLFSGYLKNRNNKELAASISLHPPINVAASFNFLGAQYSFIPGVIGQVIDQQPDYQYAPQISDSSNNDSLWVACDGGREKRLFLDENQVLFRAGHKIRTYHLLVNRDNEDCAVFEHALVFNDNIKDHDIFIPVGDAFYKGAPRELVAGTRVFLPLTLLSLFLLLTSYYYIPLCMIIAFLVVIGWGNNSEKSFSKAVYQEADKLAKSSYHA